jgi:hypothetical protein
VGFLVYVNRIINPSIRYGKYGLIYLIYKYLEKMIFDMEEFRQTWRNMILEDRVKLIKRNGLSMHYIYFTYEYLPLDLQVAVMDLVND